LVIWFVVAMNRYLLAPAAEANFGAAGDTILLWCVTALVGFGGSFFYLLPGSPNPPMAAARFGVYAVVLKGLFDFGLASALEKTTPPSIADLISSPIYGLEMVILILSAYFAGQMFVRTRKL
jgi:hypothetical protein